MRSTRIRQRVARRFNEAKAAARVLSPAERTYRYNFILHVLSGSLAGFGDAMTSVPLVMTALLSQLTTSNVVIAFLSPLRDSGWYLPQLFLAPSVDRAHLKINTYRASTVVRIAAWACMVLSIFLIQDRNLLIFSIFASTAVASFLGGFAGLPFLIVTAKIIPPNRRGLVFGLRQFIGGVLGIAAGGAVAVILGGQVGLSFPHNYALVLTFGAIGYSLAYLVFGAVREEPDEVAKATTPMHANLKQAWAIARGDALYQRYILMRIALLVATAGMPFLTVFAKRTLNVSDGFIGTLVSITLASSLLSNVVWARLSDRHSNRLVMIIASVMGLAFCAIAALATGAPAGVLNTDLAHVVLIVLYVISGAMLAGINLVSNPIMIEVAAPARQSLYIGLSNSVLGVVLLLTTLVGVVVDHFGFVGLFLFSGLAFVVALERLSGMRGLRSEPAEG